MVEELDRLAARLDGKSPPGHFLHPWAYVVYLDAAEIENQQAINPFLPLLERLPISLCADVGHLFKAGQPPVPYLATHGERIRVIHLHGCSAGCDHCELDLLPDHLLSALRDWLVASRYRGVLTLEVFSPGHFFPGRELVIDLMLKKRDAISRDGYQEAL